MVFSPVNKQEKTCVKSPVKLRKKGGLTTYDLAQVIIREVESAIRDKYTGNIVFRLALSCGGVTSVKKDLEPAGKKIL